MLSGGSSSNNGRAAALAVGTAVGTAVGSAFAPGLSAVGGAIAAASLSGEAAVDAALASPEVNLDAVKEKVEKDPSLQRREGETFQEWVKRIGIISLIDDVHEQRRFQLRANYTDKILSGRSGRTAELRALLKSFKSDT